MIEWEWSRLKPLRSATSIPGGFALLTQMSLSDRFMVVSEDKFPGLQFLLYDARYFFLRSLKTDFKQEKLTNFIKYIQYSKWYEFVKLDII